MALAQRPLGDSLSGVCLLRSSERRCASRLQTLRSELSWRILFPHRARLSKDFRDAELTSAKSSTRFLTRDWSVTSASYTTATLSPSRLLMVARAINFTFTARKPDAC